MNNFHDSIKIINKEFIQSQPLDSELLILFIVKQLNELSSYYPDFINWLSLKVIPGIHTGERSIILEHSKNKLSGIAIVKNSDIEKKLCCLRVLPEFQGTGVGLKLFERSFEVLQCDKPVLSIAEEQKEIFNRLFHHYGFKLAETYKSYYRQNKEELSFNGLIDSRNKTHLETPIHISRMEIDIRFLRSNAG